LARIARIFLAGLLVLLPILVTVGGALIYVPTDWVKQADGGVERLMNVYVSMGVTPPESMPSITDARAKKAKSSTAKTTKSTG